MNLDIARKIAQIYQERRFRSADLAAARREEIWHVHPELRRIEDQLTAENARIVAEIMRDGRPRDGSVGRDAILAQRRDYLAGHGISEDYDRVRPFCAKCQDTGFEDGLQGKKCSCYKQLLVPLLFEYSHFCDISRLTFDQFDSGLFSPEPGAEDADPRISPRERIESIRNLVLRFIRDFDLPGNQGLFFIGKPGTGKTFMAGCIANSLIREGRYVLYLNAPNLYEHISEYRAVSNAFAPDRERYEKAAAAYDSIMNCDLLILDDLGTEAYSASRQPELISVLNHRLSEGKKIVITTNLDMDNLIEVYDERLMSRVFGYFTIVRFIGDDLRHVMRRQAKRNGRDA